MRRSHSRSTTGAYFGPLPVEEALQAVERAGQLQRRAWPRRPSCPGRGRPVDHGRPFRGSGGRVRPRAELFGELGEPFRGTSPGRSTERRSAPGEIRRGGAPVPGMIETLDAIGETGFNSTVSGLLAGTLCDLERFEEADAVASRSRELASEDDFASQAAGGWRGRGCSRTGPSSRKRPARRRGDRDHRPDRLSRRPGGRPRGSRDRARGRGPRRRRARGLRGGARPVRAEGQRRRGGAGPEAAHRKRVGSHDLARSSGGSWHGRAFRRDEVGHTLRRCSGAQGGVA